MVRDQTRLVRISKYLSKYLRHEPQALGLVLAPGGWVEVEQLLLACAARGFAITAAELQQVVADNDKQRFAFDQSGKYIRANQGHSVTVDLELIATPPPEVLYHGTGEKNVNVILQTGLRKMARHHVHLSYEIETAKRVGARHGRPVIFVVDALAMQQAGYSFYVSANGVWLVDAVPVRYLKLLTI